MRWAASFLTIFFVFSAWPSFADEHEDLPVAEIYFLPWDIAPYVMQSEADIRKDYFVKTEILDGLYAYGFLESLKINEFKIAKPEPMDIKLVIDVKYLHETKTFISDGYKLCNSNGSLCRDVDDSFRNRFQAIAGETGNIQNPPIKHSPRVEK